jgi:hypothetical protein
VGLGRNVGHEPRGAGEPVAADVVARLRQRAAARAGEADDRRGGRAAGEQPGARRMRKADELGQPAHDRTLEVDVGVVAGDDARVHRGRGERGDDSGGRRRRIDPAEEGRVAVAHGVRQDIAQRRLDHVVQRDRMLGQRQVEQLAAQGAGERLPDRPRGQRGEVAGDAVHERVRGIAEGRHPVVARRARVRLAHVASIGSAFAPGRGTSVAAGPAGGRARRSWCRRG